MILLVLGVITVVVGFLAYDLKWTDPASGVVCPNTHQWAQLYNAGDNSFTPEVNAHCSELVGQLTLISTVGFVVGGVLILLAIVLLIVRSRRRG